MPLAYPRYMPPDSAIQYLPTAGPYPAISCTPHQLTRFSSVPPDHPEAILARDCHQNMVSDAADRYTPPTFRGSHATQNFPSPGSTHQYNHDQQCQVGLDLMSVAASLEVLQG